MNIKRNYPKILSFLKNQRSILVLGPRGTGKTYYLSELLDKYPSTISIDLLNKESYRRYLSSPSLLFKEIDNKIKGSSQLVTCMVDEVQLIPELLDEVHRCIEAFKGNVCFILTGSSARKLKSKDANLLAGRALKVDFFPLSFDEIDLSKDLNQYLMWGTLPEVITTHQEEIKRSFLNTYVGIYLDQEVKKEAQVRNIAGFSRFLEIAASENGQCVNYSKLGRAAGVNDVSIKEYYEILHDTLLAYYIPSWSHSKREQLQSSPKYYLFDNGIINALLGELHSPPNPSTYRYGRLYENFILGQLVQYKSKNDCSGKIYHYRDKSGKEVDFIIQKNPHSIPIALEVKSSTKVSLLDIKHLVNFKKKYPESKQIVICQTPNSYTEEGIEFLNMIDGIKRVFELAEG